MSESEHNFLEACLNHTCMKVLCWLIQHTLKLGAMHSIVNVNVNRSQFVRKKNMILFVKCTVTLASVHVDLYTTDSNILCYGDSLAFYKQSFVF
jgi:UDP-2,3-diacylglucosamine pyrophosphatase LpxH